MNPNAGRGANLFLTLKLEDGEEARFIVDTGSSTTLIDKSFEPKLGKRFGTGKVSMFGRNQQECGIYAAPKLYLGETLLLTGTRVRAYDFHPEATHVKGLLGMDCLKHYCLQWDFQARTVRFLNSDRLPHRELGKAYPITFSPGGRPFIAHDGLTGAASTNKPVTTREFPVTYALLDSGYFADGRVDPDTLKEHTTGWVHLPECVWDNQTYTNLTVGQGENANLLGLRFLARHLVTLDFPKGILYLKQTSVGPLAAERRVSPPDVVNGKPASGAETNRVSGPVGASQAAGAKE